MKEPTCTNGTAGFNCTVTGDTRGSKSVRNRYSAHPDYEFHIPGTQAARVSDLMHRMNLPHNYEGRAEPDRAISRETGPPRLFTVHTRNYLRRRAGATFATWEQRAQRYIPAITDLLKQYTDDDVRPTAWRRSTTGV